MQVINNLENIDILKTEFFNNGIVNINLDTFSHDTLKKIASYFGELLKITSNTHIKDEDYVQKISEEAILGNTYLPWHRDLTYTPGDYHGTLLAFKESDYDTYTEFLDCNKLYDSLTDAEKKYFKEIKITYGVPKKYTAYNKDSVIERDLCLQHPVTKQTTLYFSPGSMISSTKPIHQEDLLDRGKVFFKKHFWKKGDILLYDNRRMLHRRPAFKGHRELLRLNFKYEL
tara:strand:+ start:27 stop:713 length:687 start_codon:yes stop_codon:yes gene_type:complete